MTNFLFRIYACVMYPVTVSFILGRALYRKIIERAEHRRIFRRPHGLLQLLNGRSPDLDVNHLIYQKRRGQNAWDAPPSSKTTVVRSPHETPSPRAAQAAPEDRRSTATEDPKD